MIAFTIAAAIVPWQRLVRDLGAPPFGALTLGSWVAWPYNGTQDIDPYAHAAIARSGELPIGSGDGVAFFARNDDTGVPLDGRCETIISGVTPGARYWTVTLYDAEGQLVANSANRYGFTSQEIVRNADGSFDIIIGPRPRPGNWLPSGASGRYLLLIRLYDTPVGIATRSSRGRRCPPSPAADVRHDPLAALDPGRRVAWRHRASRRHLVVAECRQPQRLFAALPICRRSMSSRHWPLPAPGSDPLPYMDPGLRHLSLPLRFVRWTTQTQRAGNAGLYVGVVLQPSRRCLLRDQRSCRRRRSVDRTRSR